MKIVLERGNGPTSTFIAGRFDIEPEVFVVLGLLAAVIVGVIIYVKKNRKDG